MGARASIKLDPKTITDDAEKMFRRIDMNNDKLITKTEWAKAYAGIDENNDGTITRKEWYIKQGTTAVFDAIPKNNTNCIMRQEWLAAFDAMDIDSNGAISLSEWQHLQEEKQDEDDSGLMRPLPTLAAFLSGGQEEAKHKTPADERGQSAAHKEMVEKVRAERTRKSVAKPPDEKDANGVEAVLPLRPALQKASIESSLRASLQQASSDSTLGAILQRVEQLVKANTALQQAFKESSLASTLLQVQGEWKEKQQRMTCNHMRQACERLHGDGSLKDILETTLLQVQTESKET